jgi:folate-binding protein YgfZ
VDFGDDWLPSEAGLDDLVDTTKGCFLGQESVAKVRNLGHPPRVIQSLVASDPVSPMAVLMTEDGAPVGRITSVAPNDDGSTACIGWVRWEARDARLETEGGGFRLVRRSSD